MVAYASGENRMKARFIIAAAALVVTSQASSAELDGNGEAEEARGAAKL